MKHLLTLCFAALSLLFSAGIKAGGSVPVGTYLYANPAEAEDFKGGLRVHFQEPGKRMVIAYGYKYRKDRRSRKDTTEAEREKFKPYLAQTINDGKLAIFWHLPADFYDLVIIDDEKMTFHEGLSLLHDHDPDKQTDEFFHEIKQSLSPTSGRIGGWEAFFDSKEFVRFETDGVRGSVLVQQLRKGKAYAESGDLLQGCIHSIDICWVERAMVEDVGWQVVTRQQLYRDELPSRDFFKHVHVPELHRIRIGTRQRELGPIALP